MKTVPNTMQPPAGGSDDLRALVPQVSLLIVGRLVSPNPGRWLHRPLGAIGMNNILKYIFLVLVLTGCREKLDNEIVFFENCNLDSGNYKLLVYATEGKWIDDYRDFYIDDVETLKRMQKQWIFRHKAEVMSCGYGYRLQLVDEKRVLLSKSINIECEYMSGWIYFPEAYLKEHKDSFKKMTESDRNDFKETYSETK